MLENGTFKVPGTVVAGSAPDSDKGIKLGVLLLLIILPAVAVIAIIILVFRFHKKSSTNQNNDICEEMME